MNKELLLELGIKERMSQIRKEFDNTTEIRVHDVDVLEYLLKLHNEYIELESELFKKQSKEIPF